MAYYCAHIEDGAKSVNARPSGYGYGVRIDYDGDNMYVVHGKNGKKYVLFGDKTSNGSVVAEKMFPRKAVKIVVSARDKKLHLWIKSFMTGRSMKSTSRSRKAPRRYAPKRSYNRSSYSTRRRSY